MRRSVGLLLVIVVVILAFVFGMLWGSRRRGASTGTPPIPLQPASSPDALPAFQVPRSALQCELNGAVRVVVENPFGNVHVKQGGRRIIVEDTTYARGADRAAAQARAEGFRVTTTRSASEGLKIAVKGDQQNTDVGTSLVVTVPPGPSVTIRAPGGDVRVDDRLANVVAEATAGAVWIGKVGGKVTASTTAGEITIGGAQQGVEANTSSGVVTLRGVNGPVVARTMSGRITAEIGRSAKIRASSMSGPIWMRVLQPFSGQLQASSAQGNIALTLPAASNCQVDALTGSGPVNVTLPFRRWHRSGPNISGKLGQGVGYVKVTNDTGAIQISPIPASAARTLTRPLRRR